MTTWEVGTLRPLPVALLGEHYRRYRLPDAEAETAMACSLKRYGQIAPIVVCLRDDVPEVLDGFKRLAATRTWPSPATLSARLLAADERTAKAAIYGLNRTGRHIQELEEAWIVQALVREDGLSQVEAAELLGRHKSWVCRRLALLERLAPEAREDLRLGLLPPTAARALVQLPAGNQVEVLAVARRERLSTAELRGVVELLGAAAGPRNGSTCWRARVRHWRRRRPPACGHTIRGSVRPATGWPGSWARSSSNWRGWTTGCVTGDVPS